MRTGKLRPLICSRHRATERQQESYGSLPDDQKEMATPPPDGGASPSHPVTDDSPTSGTKPAKPIRGFCYTIYINYYLL